MAGFKEGALQLKERDLLLPSDVGTIKLLADTTGKLYTVNEFGVSARIGGDVSGSTYWNDILDKQYANNYTDGIISSATFIKINSKLDSVWKILKSNESLPITPEIGMIGINHRYALNSNIKTSGNGCDVAYWNVTTSGGITSGYWSFENKTFGSCIVNLDTNNIDSYISAVNTNWSESPANYPVGIYECISATNGTYYWNPVVINKYPTPDVSKNYFLIVDPSTSAYTWSNSISAIYVSSSIITNLSGTSIHYTSGSFDNVTIKSFGGTSAQFVKGDGSLDSTKYWTSAYHPTTLSAYGISTEDTLFDPIYLNNSVGVIDSNAPSFLDNNNGTCTIGSCNVNLRDNTTSYGRIKTYNVSSKTFTIPADGNTYFIEINYNSGNPTYQLASNAADINDSTIVTIYSCWRVTTFIGCAYFGSNGTLLSNKINYMIDDTKPYSVSNGSSLRVSEVNRLWSITSATIYSGTTKVNVPSITASNTNMYACYHSSGSWIYTSGSSLYDNLNYDDGTNLQSLGNNKWAVRWIYRAIGNPDRIFYTLGSTSYNTSASADIEQPRTDLPKVIIDHCILVGKSIIQYNAASGITRYVISTAFSSSSVTNHNDLNGILGDTPYYHLGLSGYNLINNIEALSGSSGLLKLTSGTPSLDTNSYAIASGTSAQFLKGDGSLDSSHYLTSNQNIILSGDVSGSGTSAINLSLPNIITAGTAGSGSIVPVITYDQKGRLTSVTSATIQISESQVSNLTSDLNSKLNTVTAASTYLTISNPTFSGILSGPQLSATHISAASLYDSQLSNTNVLISSGGTIIDSQISNDVLMYLSGTSANIQNQFNRLTGDFSDVDDQFLPMWSSAVNGYVNSTAATVGADKGVIVATNTYANAANDEHGPGIGVQIVIPLSGGTNTARGFRFNTGLNNELRLWQGTWGNPISWVKTFEVTSGGELVLPLTMSGEKILASNSNHGISETTIPSTYLNGLSANIQDQINNNSGIVNSALSNYLPLSGGYNNKLTGDLFTKSITMLSGCFYINNTGTDNNSAYIKYNSDSNFQINSDYSRSILFTFEGSTTPIFAIGSGSITANADITTKSIYPALGTGCAIGSSTNQYADIFVTQIGSPSAYVTDAYLGNIHGNSISTYSISTSSVVISGGTSSQFLKADGSLDSNEYVKSFSVFPLLTISGPAYVKLAQLSTNPGGSLSEINLTIYSNNSMGSNIPTVTMVDFSTTSAEINVLARTLNTDYGKAKYGYVVNGNFVELWTKLDDPWWNEFKVEVNSNSNEFSNNVGTLAYQNTDPGITFVTNVVKYDDRYLQVNQPALSGTGLLKLTSGTPSIDSTSYWHAGNHPTALTNYGISSSDTLFDAKYLGISGNAVSSSKLATARTIALSGDGTWSVSFNGSDNVTSALTLATVNSNVGSFGSATTIPTFTVNAKGLTTAASNVAIFIPHTQISDWTNAVSNVYLPLSGGTMNAGAKIRTLQDMTISTSGNSNYVNAPFVAQRNTSDSTTTTHASIGFHNCGVNAAALFYHAANSNFWYNDDVGGVYQLWSSKDFASQAITNWTTAYNWGNHASAGYLLASTASSTYLPLSGGKMSGHLLGGTPYNIGASSNWWGSIYATTIYESNVALSSKYLGIDASISYTKISDWSTATSSFLTGNQSISLTGAVTGSGTTSIATSFANTHLAGINQNLATTSSPTFAGISTTTTYGACGIFTGNADNATYSAYNLKIKSWWGIGFESYDNIARILFDTRTGNISTLGSIYEGGTALSLKYLGIDASIPSSRISDWGTYINQPLLTTSSPTFGNASIGTMVGYPNDAWFGYSGLSTATNYCGFYQVNTSDIGIAALSGHGVYLQVAQTQILDILGNGIIAHQPITGNLTGTASNASALGGVAADYFVQGTGCDANSIFGRRTTSFNYNGGAPTSTSLTDPLRSGFYDGNFTAGQTPNNKWAFLINVSHCNSSAANKFQFQLAAGFGNQHDTVDWGAENYWVRVINSHGVGDWRTLIHSDNYPSFSNFTSGLSTTTLTASGLITANGGISGNLTGHASLDIPLTGSVAVTGSIQTTQGLYAASGMVGMYSMYDNIFTIGNNAHNIQINNTTGETNFIGLTSVGMQGSLTVSGTFRPAVNSPGAPYTIMASDQGKVVMANGPITLPTTGISAGFWIFLIFAPGAQGVTFGPATGTSWSLRGGSYTTRQSIAFGGYCGWNGSTWVCG